MAVRRSAARTCTALRRSEGMPPWPPVPRRLEGWPAGNLAPRQRAQTPPTEQADRNERTAPIENVPVPGGLQATSSTDGAGGTGWWDVGRFGRACRQRVGRRGASREADSCLSGCFSIPQWVGWLRAETIVPQEPSRVPGSVRDRGGVRRVPCGVPVAGRILLSEMWSRARLLVGRATSTAVRLLPLPGFGDRGNRPS